MCIGSSFGTEIGKGGVREKGDREHQGRTRSWHSSSGKKGKMMLLETKLKELGSILCIGSSKDIVQAPFTRLTGE